MMQTAAKHDHDKCIEQALSAARDICDRREMRFTPLRRRVLELVWRGHKPVTAYELLDLLSVGQKKVAPPTVYRALDFLIEQGLVHRIESLNAFIGCPDPAHRHQGHFLICKKCRTVAEVTETALDRHITRIAADHGYSSEQSMLEVMGLCANCR
ncbi:Fur family transcriptional regulator [Luteithermobacter gelatinilyticus]|uniref:Fur family transcriptional regulator n=1 Tax=Luteithermobacter gelatinilyticus TaxID=2582913 RepID=UPI001106F9E3|nr:transcriptional repressor [Luteithermobacter gelatinilyticus]|tara:strand:+ start:20703 stop:21167 length:465 start_codon:yes stop_codon:yes gene_type:complete